MLAFFHQRGNQCISPLICDGIYVVHDASPDVDRAHGKDERLGVDSYYRGVEFYYRYVKLLGSGKS